MAESIHRVGIEIDADTGKIAARIKAIEKQLKSMEKTMSRLDRPGSGFNDRFRKMDNQVGRLGRTLKNVTGLFTKLFTTLAKFSFLAMAGEIAIFTAGLLAVKLALITGRAAASLYNITLKGLSVTAASVATALSVAAAAMREFQEAQLAPFVARGIQNTNNVTNFGMRRGAGAIGRGLGAQTSGLLGMEGSQQVVAALARAGFTGRNAIGIAQGLGDLTNFDPKAMAQIIQALGAGQKSGSVSPALNAIRGAVGVRSGTISATGMGGLIAGIQSGTFTNPAFRGQGNRLSQTFIGTAKTQFAGVRDQFADVGVNLLEPFRQSFLDIARILRENMLSLQVIIQKFGADSMGPTMVTIFDRMMRFITENIIDHLGKIKQMGESFVGFFRSVRNFFVEMGNFLGRYEPAANVIIDMFKAASNANRSSLFRNFSEGLVANADRIKEFGAGMGRLFGGIFSLFQSGNEGFFGGLETITGITDSISDTLIPALKEFFAAATPIVERIPTILEAIANVFNIISPVLKVIARLIADLIGVLGSLGTLGNIGMVGMLGAGKFFGGTNMGRNMALNAVKKGKTATLTRAADTGASSLSLGGAEASRLGAFMTRNFSSSEVALFSKQGMISRGLPMIGGAFAVKGMYDYLSFGGGSAMDTGQLSLSGTMNMGMLGAGLGAGIAAFLGGPAGAIVGAKIGGAIGVAVEPAIVGIMSLFGIESRRSKYTRGEIERLEAERAARSNLMARGVYNTGKSAAFEKDKRRLELMNIAMDDYLRTGNKSSDAMKAFYAFEGTDINNADFGMLFEKNFQTQFEVGHFSEQGTTMETRQNEMQKTAERLRNAELHQRDLMNQTLGTANAVLAGFAGTVRFTAKEVGDFAASMGFNFMDMNPGQAGAMAAVMGARALSMNRNIGVLPDFGTSKLKQAEHRLSASAALNAIAAGDISTATLEDYISKKASFEISRGGKADIAGVSGLLDLREFANRGMFGNNAGAILDFVDTGLMSLDSQLAVEHKLKNGEVISMIESGGMDALDKFLQGKADFRGAVGGNDKEMTLNKRMQILQANGVDTAAILNNVISQDSMFADGVGARSFEAMMGITNMTPEQLAKTAGVDPEELNDAITRALIDSGFGGDEEVLREILTELSAMPSKMQHWTLKFNDAMMSGSDFTEITVEDDAGNSNTTRVQPYEYQGGMRVVAGAYDDIMNRGIDPIGFLG